MLAYVTNGNISLINGNFELDTLPPSGQQYSSKHSGWSASNPFGSGNSFVVSSKDTIWGGSPAPSGNNFLAVQTGTISKNIIGGTSFIKVWNSIYQNVTVTARTTVYISYYARSRTNTVLFSPPIYGLTGLTILYGPEHIVFQNLTGSWQRYYANFSTLGIEQSKSLRFSGQTQECNYADCAFFIDNVILQFQCNPGSYAPPGSTGCTLCPVGKYSNVTGASSSATCINCGIHYYNSQKGESSCKIIPKGYYANNTDPSIIIPCISGSFNNKTGSLSVSDCRQRMKIWWR
jgi:hypothetical protein